MPAALTNLQFSTRFMERSGGRSGDSRNSDEPQESSQQADTMGLLESSSSALDGSGEEGLLSLVFGGVRGLVWNSGIACMAIAAFLQSLSALCVKMTKGRVPPFELVAVRSSVCLAVTLTIIRMRGISPVFGSSSSLVPLVIRGITGASSMSLYYFAIFRLPLADAMTLYFTHPAMVVGLAWLCLGEQAGWTGVLGIVLSLAGVLVLVQPPFITGGADWSANHITGASLCLAAAFLAAAAFVSIRYLPKTEASLSIASWFHIMGVASTLPPLLLDIPDSPVVPRALDMCLMAGIVACSFLSQAFLSRAFLCDNASRVAAVGYLQVVLGHFYGVFLLHDPESAYGILGSVIICLGVVAVSWPTQRSQHGVDYAKLTEPDVPPLDETTVIEISPLESDHERQPQNSADSALERQ